MLQSQPGSLALVAAIVAAALISAAALPVLMPLLRRYALARPNARSSHVVPTPQGGGIAVVGAVLVVLAGAIVLLPWGPAETLSLAVVAGAALVLAVLGGIDDIRPLPALPRLLVQALAVGAVLWTLPEGVRVFPDAVPLLAERIVLLLAALWFVNLTNFMDGLDWMTVVGFAPLSAALVLLASLGVVPAAGGLVAAALLGALAGFAPWNKPVARVFLGDVGSLPIGLFAGYALLRLAGTGHVAAAAILPLYYLADATITLVRRLLKGERVWDAHRTHYYQRATDRGLTVAQVVTRVALANLALAVVAMTAAVRATTGPVLAACVAALAAVFVVLMELSRPRRTRSGG